MTNRQHVMSSNSISSYLEFTEFLRCRLIFFIRFDKFSAIAHVKLDIFFFLVIAALHTVPPPLPLAGLIFFFLAFYCLLF